VFVFVNLFVQFREVSYKWRSMYSLNIRIGLDADVLAKYF